MEPVVRAEPHAARIARRERGDKQRGAPDVEHRVFERHLLRQQPARALAVAISFSGTHTTTARSRPSGTRTLRPPATATAPPAIDAATLSAWPSSSVASRRSSRCAVWSGRPACTRAAASPPTRAAPENPSPRPLGMRERT